MGGGRGEGFQREGVGRLATRGGGGRRSAARGGDRQLQRQRGRFGQEYFLLEYLFGRFFFSAFLVQFLGHEFTSIFASNGYNTRVSMDFHIFG